MKICRVLQGFAGPAIHGATGQIISLPNDIAESYQQYGLVTIISDEPSPVAFETAKQAREFETPEDNKPKTEPKKVYPINKKKK